MVRTSLPILLTMASFATSAQGVPVARPGELVEGVAVARVAAPEGREEIALPSPFAPIPGAGRVAVFSDPRRAVLLAQGERVLRELPAPVWVQDVQDLVSDGTWLVTASSPGDVTTCRMVVYDLAQGTTIGNLTSNNPFLRREGSRPGLWRVVIAKGRGVGIYQPTLGATLPLWTQADGKVESAAQVQGQTAGLGHESVRVVPYTDGAVGVWSRGSTRDFASAQEGVFLDPLPGGAALFLRPDTRSRFMPAEHSVHVLDREGRRAEFRLAARDPAWNGNLTFRGRPVRVSGSRIVWIFAGPGFVEFREAELTLPPDAGDG